MTHVIVLLLGIVIGFTLAWLILAFNDLPSNAVLDRSACREENVS